MDKISNFGDCLYKAVSEKRSNLVAGLDPRPEDIPLTLLESARAGIDSSVHGSGREAKSNARALFTAVRRFCVELIDATQDLVCAVKPQVAFFEQMGPAGYRILGDVIARASKHGLLVISDAKRGDIGTTSDAYAKAWFAQNSTAGVPNTLKSDAITIAPYLGKDTISSFEPFFREGCGAFVLCRTSNKSARDFQDVKTAEGRVWERAAALIAEWGVNWRGESGLSSVGAVVGATYPEEGLRAREILPGAWFLVPGLGAQGGKSEDARNFTRPDGSGAVFNVSRGIMYAYKESEYARFGETGFADAARAAAEKYRAELWETCGMKY